MRTREWGWLAAAFLVAAFTAWLRWRAQSTVPVGRYAEEFALQFRYARMVAEGKPIPIHDEKLQAPTGVWVQRSYPTLMERVAGVSYRGLCLPLGNPTFADFIPLFQSVVSALGVLACILAARSLHGDRCASVVAGLLFGLSLPPALRLVGTFGQESFALPFLFLGTAFFSMSVGPRLGNAAAWWMAIAAAACLLIAALAWHFSRFYLTGVAGAGLAACVAMSAGQTRLRNAACIVTIAFVVAATVFPLLRATRFAVGLPTTMFAALAISAGFAGRTAVGWLGRLATVALLAAGATGVAAACSVEGTDYGHVWELAWAKLAHWDVKPADPKALSFDVRVLWSGVFHGPTLEKLLWTMGPLYLAVGFAGLRAFFQRDVRGTIGAGQWLLAFMAMGFLALHLAIDRLAVVAAFFLAAFGSAAFAKANSVMGRWALRFASVLFLAAMLANYPATPVAIAALAMPQPVATSSAVARYRPYAQVDESLLTWIRLETPADAVFAGRFNLCPTVLAYADRAIVLHTKFEVPGIRAQVAAHFAALYGSEDALADFCRDSGATHYLHDAFATLGAGADFPRYLGDSLRLARSSAAYRMQFDPSSLRRFSLVYQNSLYRVYEVRPDRAPDIALGAVRATRSVVGGQGRLFDLGSFHGNGAAGDGDFVDDGVDAVFEQLQEANGALRQAIDLFVAGRWPEALPIYDAVLAFEPMAPYARSHRAWIKFRTGLLTEASAEIERAVADDPFEAEGWRHAFWIRRALGNEPAAQWARLQCQRIDPTIRLDQ